uniref:DUF2067 domain-containing protein n=1 Tax=Ignisphaera aggregans TaxID=334771 RepID=A0A7C4BE54_9CREN
MEGVFVERSFTYSCPSKNFCVELLEKLDEELALEAELYAELKQDKIVFKVFGLEPSVEATITKIKNYIAHFTKIRTLSPKQGLTAEQLAKFVHKAIPLDVLAEVLKRQGVTGVAIRKNTIYADTDLETVQAYAQLIAKVIDKTANLKYSHNLKKAIIAAIVLYNISIPEALETLRECNVLNESEELAVPWQSALDCYEERIQY